MTRKRHTLRQRDPGLAARVGARIRQYRRAAAMTQQALAEGWCTKAAISAMENQHTLPSLDALSHIADRLGVPIAAFVSESATTSDVFAVIRQVEIERGRVVAELSDGRIVGVPIEDVDGLLDASVRAVGAWRLSDGRQTISWPALGVQLEVRTMLGGDQLAAEARGAE